MLKTDPVPLEPVRILCAADAAYAASLCVMLVSLLINHAKNRKIEIYVLASEIPEDDRRKIETSLRANRLDFELSSLHWLSPSRDIVQGLPVSDHINLEAYSRLLAPLVLPQDVTRVLYLDSDMVILSDLSTLYDSPQDDCAIHATRDIDVGTVCAKKGVFNFADLGIPPKTPYFNSGVLLINLRHWREENVMERILQYLKHNKDSVHYHDQGGMNAILHDSWAEIDLTWNQTRSILWPEQWRILGYSSADWRRVKNHPKIVHYTTPDKPWLPHMRRPGYSYFFKYLDKTSYRTAFKGKLLENIIGFRLYFFLWSVTRRFTPKQQEPVNLATSS